jgi:hypothetical protein
VPQARQMLRKLLDGHIVCEPIMQDGKRGYRFTATGTTGRREGCQRIWWRAPATGFILPHNTGAVKSYQG